MPFIPALPGRAFWPSKDDLVHFFFLREKSSHILEQSVGKGQSDALSSVIKRKEHKIGVSGLQLRGWVLEDHLNFRGVLKLDLVGYLGRGAWGTRVYFHVSVRRPWPSSKKHWRSVGF